MKPSVAVARQAQAAARTAENTDRIEAKLDLIMKHLGISLTEQAPEPEPVTVVPPQEVAPEKQAKEQAEEQAIASKPAGKKK